MEDEIKKKKYSMVIRHVESDEDEVDVALELVKEKRLAGLIFLGGHFVHSEEKLSKLRIPSTVIRNIPILLNDIHYLLLRFRIDIRMVIDRPGYRCEV